MGVSPSCAFGQFRATNCADASSINDIEGVSERSIKLRAFGFVKVPHGAIVEIFERHGEHVVATDYAPFRESFVTAELDLGPDTSNCPGYRRTGDSGQYRYRRIASQHTNGSSTGWLAEVGPYDVVASYHAGDVRAASRPADRTRAASGG